MSDLSDFFQSVTAPALPEVAHALIRTLHDGDATMPQISTWIAQDPALTAQVLRAAAGAAQRRPPEPETLDAAIAILGLPQVRTLALAACMSAVLPVAPGLDRAVFWRHCTVCAGYAQWLAGGIGLDTQQAWLAGMMLRLGELLIVQTRPQTLAELERQPQRPGERWTREQRSLGFTETQVTAELAHRWHFPADMVRGLSAASAPLACQPLAQLGAVLHLAGHLADMADHGPVLVDDLPRDVVSGLDLNLDWLRSRLPAHDTFFDMAPL